MAQTYKTGLIITGDASGGIRAIKATEDELGKLNQRFDRGSRRSRQFNQDVNATSQGLAVLRRAAAPIAGAIAGMFAANSLQNQINWGDQLQKTNLRIGASTEALSQYNYVASLSGVEFNQLTTAWQRQTRRIAEAAAGTGVAVAALDRLNLSAQELNQLAPEDQFERIAEAMQGVENSSERVRLAQQLWDSEGVKLVQIVNQGTGAMAAMRAEADALGLTISQDTANAMASYNDEVDRLKFAAQGVSQTLLSELVPAMTEGLQNVNAFIQEAGGAEVVVGHLTDGAQVLAALLAGRYAAAFATSAKNIAANIAATYAQAQADVAATAAARAKAAETLRVALSEQAAAKRAAENARAIAAATGNTALRTKAINQMAAANQRAIGAEAAHTAAVNASSVAMARSTVAAQGMSVAARAGASAYAMLGGPLGLLVGAGGLLYAFREEIGLVRQAAEPTTERIDNLTDAINRNSVAAVEAGIVNLSAEYFTLGQRAAATTAQIERLNAAQENDRQGAQARLQNNMRLRDLREELAQIVAEQEAAGEASTRLRETLEGLGETAVPATSSLTDLGDTTREAAKQTTSLANSYENLLDRIQPNRRAARQYAQDVGTLNLALATGRINAVQYMQAMGMLQESFQAAQRETDNLATASEDASQCIANSFLSWETVADNTLRRIDDSGQSLWLGLIDGSESALDTVKRGFQQTLAEIAHMLTTQKLTFQVAGMMGLDTTGMPGGGGFNLGSLGSLYSSATKLPYVGDAISGIGSALGFGASAAAPSLAMQGGLSSAALASASQVAGGATYGGWAGSAASGAALGNAATGGIMSSITAGVSAAMPWIAGGLAIDSLLGGGITKAISGLFGGGKTAPKFELATVGRDVDPTRHGLFENYGEGVYSRGALGTVGFYDPNTARLEETFDGFENAKAFLDGITALDNAMVGAVANLDNGAEKTQAMANAAQAVRLNAGDAAGIANQLATRTLAVVDVIDGDFSAALRGLGLDAEQITGRVVQAANAMQLLDSNSARLNLQFDASAAGAMRAADGMAQLMGGVGNLNASLGSFYDAFYTEEEKLRHLAEDLSSTFASMGRELPTTREGVRDVVESLELMGAAGQEQLATILQLNQPLAQYIAAMEEQRQAAVESGEAIDDNAESMRAQADIARERAGLERELLSLQGNTAELRRRELASLDPSNQALQSHIWALGDVQSAYQQVEKAVNAERQILENAYRATTASINANISTVQQAMQESTAVANTLSNSLDTLLNARRRESMASRRAAQDYLQSTLASGGLGDSAQLERALGAVSEPSEGLFSSFTDYQRDFYQTANVIASLEERAEAQVSVEEQSLKALENQLQAAERQHAREMESLDSMLVQQQLQIENELGQMAWLESINGSVLGVGEAIGGLQSAISSAISSAAASAASAAKAASETARAGAAPDYLSAKAEQLNTIAFEGRANWTRSQVSKAFAEAGLTQQEHYERFGKYENIRGFDGSHADGLWSVPFDGYRAELHRSETVLPAPAAQAFRDFAGGGGGGELLKAFQQLIQHVENLEKEVSELKSINKGTASHTSKIASTVDRMRRETME